MSTLTNNTQALTQVVNQTKAQNDKLPGQINSLTISTNILTQVMNDAKTFLDNNKISQSAHNKDISEKTHTRIEDNNEQSQKQKDIEPEPEVELQKEAENDDFKDNSTRVNNKKRQKRATKIELN